jgi:hypothetical protein
METFVMLLSGGLAVAWREPWDDASAAGAEPCPLRNRENMGCLLTSPPLPAAAVVFFDWSNF